MESWTEDANEALHLSLVRAAADKEILTEEESFENFHPTFTYPIYGEEEKLYGYRDLVIDLRFASGSLVQYLNVNFAEKLDSTSTMDDAEGILQNFIHEGYYKDEKEFTERVEKDAIDFRPLGEKIFSYKRKLGPSKGKDKGFDSGDDLDESKDDVVVFEVFHATWDTQGFREYHRLMQLFILLYIEAGSYIKEDEEGWEFVMLYEKRKRRDGTPTYHFAGYSTLFPFFCFPDRVRMRLSQFVILPPYQKKGHGSALYTAIYRYVLSQGRIAELTVEDPAEAFEDLRDRNDLHMLLSHEKFITEALGGPKKDGKLVRGKAKLGPPAEKGWVEKWRQDLKIAGNGSDADGIDETQRQFHRLIEMLIILRLDHSDQKAVRAYRLQVKERLYKFNYEVLAQMDKEERVQKLEETFQNVTQDYRRILAMI